MKLPKSFNSEKVNLLKNLYPNSKKEDILQKFPNYCWRSLQNIANFLKIKREICENRNGDISILFNKSYLSYYWIGLILSDGSLLEDGTLKIDLAIKDKDYLKNFADYLQTKISFYPRYKNNNKNSTGICRVKVKDNILGRKLREFLGITQLKTYEPFSLDFISNKYELVAFLCGFIDGDGTITKLGSISIDCHKNYYDLFYHLGTLLVESEIISSFNLYYYKDMCRISFQRFQDVKNIKDIATKMRLPLMERKWSRVRKEIKSKNRLLDMKATIKILRKREYTLKQICKAINYKTGGNISIFCKNHNI